jgi:hypothetical protein
MVQDARQSTSAAFVGALVGTIVGFPVGTTVCSSVGDAVGLVVGIALTAIDNVKHDKMSNRSHGDVNYNL